jgi:hypothetical protein
MLHQVRQTCFAVGRTNSWSRDASPSARDMAEVIHHSPREPRLPRHCRDPDSLTLINGPVTAIGQALPRSPGRLELQ